MTLSRQVHSRVTLSLEKLQSVVPRVELVEIGLFPLGNYIDNALCTNLNVSVVFEIVAATYLAQSVELYRKDMLRD